MTQTPRPRAHSSSRAAIPAIVTLALWRARRTWRLLLLAGMGILAAVTLVCTVPFYSRVAMTAGLGNVLAATPQGAELTLQASANVLTPTIAAQEFQSLNQVMQRQLKPYLQPTTEFFLQTPFYTIDAPFVDKSNNYNLLLDGAPMQAAAHHTRVLRGRLPAPQSHALEIALTQQAASYLNVDIGSMMHVGIDFVILDVDGPVIIDEPLQVVGIIASNPADPFWHGQDFDPPPPKPRSKPQPNYTALVSKDAYLETLQEIVNAHQWSQKWFFGFGSSADEPTLYWYYHLNSSSIGIDQVDDLSRRLQTTQAQIATGQFTLPRSIFATLSKPQLSGPAVGTGPGTSTLEHFRSRISLVSIPVTLALLQVVALMLFFVGLMASLLVERQADVLALLRSRGASRLQLFGAFVTQSLGLALLALLAGPLLAIPVTRGLSRLTLSSADQQALRVISGNPVPVALTVGWFALITALGAVAAMVLAIRGLSTRDILALRRESARATR